MPASPETAVLISLVLCFSLGFFGGFVWVLILVFFAFLFFNKWRKLVCGVGLCYHILTIRRLESLISSSKLKNYLLDPIVVPAFQAGRVLCMFYTVSDLLYTQAITFSPKYYLFLLFPTTCCFPPLSSSYLCSAFAFPAVFLALTLSYFLPFLTFQAPIFRFFSPDLSPTLFPAHPAPGPSRGHLREAFHAAPSKHRE